MAEPKLDWRPHWDRRNTLYAIRKMDCYTDRGASRARTVRRKAVWLDQGSEGACTGFGLEHVRALSPRAREVSNETARRIYLEARRQDEWEGEDYEGSSVNGAMKAARLFNLIREWRWAQSIAEIRHGLSYHGAFELGVWWYTGMMRPDSAGLIYTTGEREGGHALALAGYRVDPSLGRVYRLENSWGPDWGDRGGCWLREVDLTQLLGEQGEAAIPWKL